MATSENSNFTEDDDYHQTSSLKRAIILSSDDEHQEMNENNKRQRSSSLPKKLKPLQLMNKQPVIRNTRQTSLSIVRTNSDDNDKEERKWNLKMITTSLSNQSSFKQQKKKVTQTV